MDKIIYSAIMSVLMANSINPQIVNNSGIDKMLDESVRFYEMNKKSEKKVDKKVLLECIEYLQENPKVEYNPYPVYDGRVMVALALLEPDYDYLSHYEAMNNMPIDKMNIDNIKTMLTFINRGERFCDGHIASFVEDGCLLRLLQRLSELTK